MASKSKNSKLVESFNGLGHRLLTTLKPTEDKPNVLISSYSISEIFSLLHNGASDSNKKEIKQVFGLPQDSMEINEASTALRKSLASGESAQVSIANSVWVKNPYKVADSFKPFAEKYEAPVIPFEDEVVINQWVKDATKGHIPKLLEKLDEDCMMVLVNAVFFQAMFIAAFDEKKTKTSEFNGLYGKSQVKMMNSDSKKPYFEDKTYQAVKLAYKSPQGADYETIIVLPSRESKIEQVLLQLQNGIPEGFYPAPMVLQVPKLHLEFDIELTETLGGLGLKESFTRGSFPLLSEPGNLAVSQVVHKCVLDMDEKGTTAAAATAVVMTRGGSPPRKIDFKVNRPFILYVREANSGINLFSAVVNQLN